MHYTAREYMEAIADTTHYIVHDLADMLRPWRSYVCYLLEGLAFLGITYGAIIALAMLRSAGVY